MFTTENLCYTDDITGQKFGSLTAVRRLNFDYISPKGRHHSMWLFSCDCGGWICTKKKNVLRKETKHCFNCRSSETKKSTFETRVKNTIGKSFGKLTVIAIFEDELYDTKEASWLCRCDCGREVIVHSANLKKQFSCGKCETPTEELVEIYKKINYVCNFNSFEKKIWQSIRARCTNPVNPLYRFVGEKGTKVCDEWRESFGNFGRWLFENGYDFEKRRSFIVALKDWSGNYEPDNCKINYMTKRSRKLFLSKGTRNMVTVGELAKILKLHQIDLSRRIERKPVLNVLNDIYFKRKSKE